MNKRRPSMRDVAHAASVSVSAVSLVVRGKPGVADETRERVWQAIAQLGYTVAVPEITKTASVGLLIERDSMPVILDVFYGDVIRGFQMEAQRLGYQVLLHMFDHAAESLDSLRSSLAGEVDGLVVANDGEITPAMIIQLEALHVPLVLVESYLPGQHIPTVLGDNFTAGYAVMQHVLNLGHRSIAILRGPRKYSRQGGDEMASEHRHVAINFRSRRPGAAPSCRRQRASRRISLRAPDRRRWR